MRFGILIVMSICLFVFSVPCQGSDIESRVKALEETLKSQQKTIEGQQNIINRLKEEVKKADSDNLTMEDRTPEPPKVSKSTGLFGGSALNNPNISLVLNTFYYGSGRKDGEIQNQSIPGYTTTGLDRRNGFNLDAAELFLFAPVDPYFNLYATIPVSENGAELEEAYVVSTALLQGHQLKGGKFKSGFSRLNSQHPHAWDFADIPLAYRAFIGDEGLNEKGVQCTYLPPLPFYTLLGVEVLQGDSPTLFGTNATGGPHAFTAFAKFSFDIGDDSAILFGPSIITGKTETDTIRTDSDFTGKSTLYEMELTYKWKPSRQQSFTFQSEYMFRTQHGDLRDTGLDTIERLDRQQDGFYAQGVYQRERWRFGVRYDCLGIFKDDHILAGEQQNFGGKPWRATGMIEFNLTEFTRLRLQYNHDESLGQGEKDNAVFLQAIFGIGAHAAHPF